jgi:hypothetical protein
MAISDERVEQFQAEVRRRVGEYLEHRRDSAPDGPGLGIEDYAELERGFGWDLAHEPGWGDVLALWRDNGSHDTYEPK